MYKEILSQKNDVNIINRETSKGQEKIQSNTNLKFNDILCPMTCKSLSSNQCKTCQHKKELVRKHQLGLTLLTMICTWSEPEDDF
ncbi:MAG: hypothetical protein FK734_18010 [Asgard group archaeon]|nr:hypothetical protein [Asgard group archaeon]